jgi:hypothetical protein
MSRSRAARSLVSSIVLSLLALALGCSGDDSPGTSDGGARDAGRPGIDAGRDAGVDGGSPRDGGRPVADGGGDAGTTPGAVRFVAMGDTGEGNAAQREVAIAVRDLCASEGCDFVMLLGDNIYNSGVDSVDDSQWTTKFEEPYADIDLPFHPVLGNHDYGGTLFGLEQGGLGNEFDKGPIEVEYTKRSTRWTMPATFYTLQFENVGFVMLDTNSILWNDTSNGDQLAWYAGAVDGLRADGAEWIIVAGHHPYRSNGTHGNAGSYESIEVGGIEVPNPVPILNGGNVQRFFEDFVCGTADVVLAGHDHNRQWLDEPDALCGAELIVSGAGAKTKDLEGTGNATQYADADTEGFFYFVIEGDRLYGRVVDRDGTMAFEREIARTPRP